MSVCCHFFQQKTVRMAGRPGQSGQSARSPAGRELNRGEGHAMPPVIPAPEPRSRHASAAWANATAVVSKFSPMSTLRYYHYHSVWRAVATAAR